MPNIGHWADFRLIRSFLPYHAETSRRFDADQRGGFHEFDEVTFYKADRTTAVEAALSTEPFQRFLTFVQWPIWVTEPGKVRLLDLRFGDPRAPGFLATAVVDERNRVREAEFGMGGARPR